MPSHYAHYRFGASAMSAMPPEVRRNVQRFRQLYDVGLHGPDIFFYHNIFLKDNTANPAKKYHRQTGREFFTRVCKRIRLEPSEGAMAYLYGVLTHYCLDTACHPYIHTITADAAIGHTELETEFDRFLLTKDGKKPPHTFDCSPHMKLTRGECVTAAEFYPDVTPAMVNRSIRGMAACVKFLASPTGFRRNMMNGAISLTGGAFDQFIMSRQPNPRCCHLNEDLMALYDQALERFPRLLEEITAHMLCNAPLGEEFEHPFG